MNDDYDINYQDAYDDWERVEPDVTYHVHCTLEPIRSRQMVRMERQMKELLLSANEYKQSLGMLHKTMLDAALSSEAIRVALYTNTSS